MKLRYLLKKGGRLICDWAHIKLVFSERETTTHQSRRADHLGGLAGDAEQVGAPLHLLFEKEKKSSHSLGKPTVLWVTGRTRPLN